MDTSDTFFSELEYKIKNSLIGEKAHLKMSPVGRDMFPPQNANPTKSAVLIAFYYHNNKLHFPLIKRTSYNGAHSGQMALPGGKFEESDISLENTALREAEEEIGIKAKDVSVIGSLSEIYISVTNYTVLPIVGFINYKPTFIPEKTEVDSVFPIKLNDVLNPENKFCEKWELKNEDIMVPFYKLADKKVWGATAMILSELEQLINE